MPRGRCWSLFCSGSLLCSLHRYGTGSLNDRIKLAIICVEIQHCPYYVKGCQDYGNYHYCHPHKVPIRTGQIVIVRIKLCTCIFKFGEFYVFLIICFSALRKFSKLLGSYNPCKNIVCMYTYK